MPIQILSPQLTNQIAAGEVVERPASVVKELIENSLDAGADQIVIEIEQGGSKLIRIRDNGCGIPKDELALALARHATSKIHCIEDLDAILSLGFRGEALASISSVARLTLTSRPKTQNEAWQAYAEGRDMTVTIKPAAHPVGTTIEVLDLFYNTPARRKFMRTEKTEFTHIDEVIRRIALAKCHCSFSLSHNGKLVRHYRHSAQTDQQQINRLTTICGNKFMQQAVTISWQHELLTLQGWVARPNQADQFSDLHYCYVNGRIIRDRLITHAIRQAYQTTEQAGELAYILYIDIDPQQIDVNVHPAKHEIRFHQSRLIHDFIYQAISNALATASQTIGLSESDTIPPVTTRISAGRNQFDTKRSQQSNESTTRIPASQRAAGISSSVATGHRVDKERDYHPTRGIKELELYQHLTNPELSPSTILQETPTEKAISTEKPPLFPAPYLSDLTHYLEPPTVADIGKVLSIWQDRYAIILYREGIALLSLLAADYYVKRLQLVPLQQTPVAQPLLIPVVVTLAEVELQAYERYHEWLARLAITVTLQKDKKLEISAVPALLRQQDLASLIPHLLTLLGSKAITFDRFIDNLIKQLQDQPMIWSQAQAVTILADLERLMPNDSPLTQPTLLTPISLQQSQAVLDDHE